MDGDAMTRARRGGTLAAALTAALALGGCGGRTELPPPRPLIVHSGARLSPEADRMKEIDAWVQPQLQEIREDPSFLIRTVPTESMIYPWDGLTLSGDTAAIRMQGGVPEARVPYMIYAHLRLMNVRGELGEWLPEGADSVSAGEFELEQAMLRRTADAWLYGRSVWDAPPHDVLDEIMYAKENGYLSAMIFTARPNAFADARAAWVDENPAGIEEYRRWFVDTFDREPPGLRSDGSQAEAPAGERR